MNDKHNSTKLARGTSPQPPAVLPALQQYREFGKMQLTARACSR